MPIKMELSSGTRYSEGKKKRAKNHNKPQVSRIHSLCNNTREVLLQNGREAVSARATSPLRGASGRDSLLLSLLDERRTHAGVLVSVWLQKQPFRALN